MNGGCWRAERSACRGELDEYTSKSGCTTQVLCELHGAQYLDEMQALDERLQRDYPGYDNPHSMPPAWFDPAYAGEQW